MSTSDKFYLLIRNGFMGERLMLTGIAIELAIVIGWLIGIAYILQRRKPDDGAR